MKLFELIDEKLFNEMVELRYIDIAKHPDYDLWILDYSKHCALDGMWNEVTMTCRGLIIDAEKNIVSWPFYKFFNYEELETLASKHPELHLEVPNLPFRVFEKLDGSLGVGYWVNGKLYITTKGSFESEQSAKANEILNAKYPGISEKLNQNYTYLFEIIYPENRIVVNYGDTEDVVLIGVKDTSNGQDIFEDYSNIIHCVKEYDGFTDWKQIREMVNGDNREGFVVRFENGFRMKMKYEDYFKKHFLKSYLTEKHVFLFYEEGRLDELNDIVNNMDEENQITVARMLKKFDMHRDRIRKTAHEEFEKMGYPLGTVMDKESAARIHKECKYSTMVFRLIRGFDIEIDVMRALHKEIKFLEDEE